MRWVFRTNRLTYAYTVAIDWSAEPLTRRLKPENIHLNKQSTDNRCSDDQLSEYYKLGLIKSIQWLVFFSAMQSHAGAQCSNVLCLVGKHALRSLFCCFFLASPHIYLRINICLLVLQFKFFCSCASTFVYRLIFATQKTYFLKCCWLILDYK